MDRRLHTRSLADLDVQLTRLRKLEASVAGRIADVSEAGLCLVMPCEFWPEELVKIETADSTLYGHVIYSTWKRNAFRTGIEVERVLLGGSELAELLRAALRNTMPAVLSR